MTTTERPDTAPAATPAEASDPFHHRMYNFNNLGTRAVQKYEDDLRQGIADRGGDPNALNGILPSENRRGTMLVMSDDMFGRILAAGKIEDGATLVDGIHELPTVTTLYSY